MKDMLVTPKEDETHRLRTTALEPPLVSHEYQPKPSEWKFPVLVQSLKFLFL